MLVDWATEIKVRAERRAGEMLAVMAETGSLTFSMVAASGWDTPATLPVIRFGPCWRFAKPTSPSVPPQKSQFETEPRSVTAETTRRTATDADMVNFPPVLPEGGAGMGASIYDD